MSTSKHTPGPWELDIGEYGFRIRMGSAVPYTGVYKPQHLIEWDPGVYHAPDYPETDAENRQYLEAEANAHLIAAAPEMYEALEALLYEHKPCGGELWHKGNEICECERCDGIRFVLAKARGEAS